MGRRSLDQFFLWVAVIFVIVAIVAVFATQWYSAREIDRSYIHRSEHVVENGVLNYAEAMTQLTLPQANWDDAVRNLDNRFSGDWAREYIGEFFWRTGRFERITTLDRDDRLTFTALDGLPADAGQFRAFREASAPLIAKVRNDERRRGPLTRPDRRAIAHSGLVRVDGAVYAVAAALVQPDGSVFPRTDRSAMILLGKRLDDAVVARIGEDYILTDPRLVPISRKRDREWARALLRDPHGTIIAGLEWRSRKPGEQLMRESAPVLGGFALLLAGAAGLVMRKGRAIARDLTASEARASHMAFSDKLTGLPNRAALEQAYDTTRDRQSARGEAMAVLCIDIDRFKAVNDAYGHPAGDSLLCQVAARISEVCDSGDVLGRFGGDEFILLSPAASAAAAARLGHLVVTILAAPFDIGPGRVFVGGSVGIFMLRPGTTIDAPEAFRRADLAMYRAKELGRGQYAFYDGTLDDTVRARQEVQDALRRALGAGGLDVQYQPQVDESGALIGAEALVHWPEARDKGIPTAAFVHLAEETGLIDDLGMQVMQRVFADSARWPGLPIGINLSAVQLRAEDFNDRIEGLLAESGADPHRFEFEITEGLLLDQNDETIAKLERLRRLGCKIALDDFGTGYCGLSYLHQYPIDAVKIDMSFTGLLGKEPSAQALVETMVRLAAALDLEIIAEGVETANQRRLLLAAGCQRFQGYLTGQPVSSAELTKRFDAESRQQDCHPPK